MSVQKTCEVCGKEFRTDTYKRRTCSKRCGYKIRKSGKKGKTYPHLWKKPESKMCPVCGKLFEAIFDRNGKRGGITRDQKYCSKRCWEHRGVKKSTKCPICGKVRTDMSSRKRIYCSNSCRNKHYRVRLRGDKSHFWKGGKTAQNQLLRSRTEYAEWRQKVFERDNYTCQECWSRSGKGIKVILHPHHIKLVSEFPELIYDVDNGITLCDECHYEKHAHLLRRKKAVKL